MSSGSHNNIELTVRSLPNQTFSEWLKKQTALFIGQLLGLAGVIYVFAALIYYLKYLGASPNIFDPKKIQEFVIYAHIPFLLMFIVKLLNILDQNATGSYRSRTVYKRIFEKGLGKAQLKKSRIQLRRFKLYFLYFWILMFVLYTSFIFQSQVKSSPEIPNKSKVAENLKKARGFAYPWEITPLIRDIEKLVEEENDAATKNEANSGHSTEKKDNSKFSKEEKKDNSKSLIVEKKAASAYQNDAKTAGLIEDIEGINRRLQELMKIYELDSSGKIDNIMLLRKADYYRLQTIDREMPAIYQNIVKADLSVNKTNEIGNSWEKALYSVKFELFVFAANNISVLFIFFCFTILAFPWHARKHFIKMKRIRIVAGMIIVIITLLFPALLFLSKLGDVYYEDRVKTYVILADAVSGLINAIILALFIARLDSKLIGLPSYLISILYGYSAIQPLFVVFEQPGELQQILKAFVFIVVFIFKIYFFLIIIYAMQTGRMLDYLVCFPKLFGRVDSIFANQFQIEIDKEEKEKEEYKFLIKNENETIYFGSKHFKSKEECQAAIEEARRIMKEKASYKTKESFGTYTIDVYSDKEFKDKICSSIDLKSQDEANDLITESIVNVPYCKYIKTKVH